MSEPLLRAWVRPLGRQWRCVAFTESADHCILWEWLRKNIRRTDVSRVVLPANETPTYNPDWYQHS